MPFARVRRKRNGRFAVRLGADERRLLAGLPAELRELMADGSDPALVRLFPPAYVADEAHEAEYRRLMGDDLSASHLAALEVMEATAHADELDEEQLSAWMRAVNELRLVLGTRLDVSEDEPGLAAMDPDDPRLPAYALYGWLGLLQEEIVAALGSTL